MTTYTKVFPACAGMIPDGGVPGELHVGVPRMCGDDPWWTAIS